MIYEKPGKLNGHECWKEEMVECPDCGSEIFYHGPEGGNSKNMMCAICYSKFNEMGRLGFHRI